MAKPTEIKKVAALLESHADSAEEMSKMIWELVEELIAQREQYVAVVAHPSIKVYQAVGPYPTENQLRKDYKKRITQYDEKSFAFIARLASPSTIMLD